MTFSRVKWPEIPGFVWAYTGLFVLMDSITFLLLIWNARFSRSRSVFVLATAYLFAALATISYFLAFPGITVDGYLMGGTQSAIWLYYLWRIGFLALLGVSSALMIRRRNLRPLTRRWGIGVLAATLATALVVALVTLGAPDSLPTLLAFQPPPPTTTTLYRALSVLTIMVGLGALVVTVQAARSGSRLRLWLSVVVGLFLADVIIQLVASNRYDLGWYTPRILALVGGLVLLALLISEVFLQYRELDQALDSQDTLWLALQKQVTELDYRSSHDSLTNVLTPDAFERALDQLISTCRPNHVVALLYVDLDKFKEINDSLSHSAGDEALVATAASLVSHTRPDGQVGRVGGDEFVVAVPGLEDRASAARVADELCLGIAGLTVERGQTQIAVSASIGVAISCEEMSGLELMDAADHAMYVAKSNGGSRSWVFDGKPTPS